MKAKKEIDKQILITGISTLIFVIVLIITVIIVLNSLFGYMKGKEKIGGFIVDYGKTKYIKEKLSVLSNAEGIKTEGYEITITNNAREDGNFYLYVKNKNGKEIDNHLMVSLNNYIIKKVDAFPYDEDYYILYEGSIKPGFSSTHILRFWWDYESPSEYAGKEVELEYGIIER